MKGLYILKMRNWIDEYIFEIMFFAVLLVYIFVNTPEAIAELFLKLAMKCFCPAFIFYYQYKHYAPERFLWWLKTVLGIWILFKF